MTLDLEAGDQVLLCSDGLTGVVSDEDIASELTHDDDAESALQRLIDLANDGGGPDNITAILLRVSDTDPEAAAAAPRSNGGQPVVVRTREDGESEDWARRLGSYGSMNASSPWAADEQGEAKRSGVA
jgi:PPM family protein phosphatase